MACVSWLRVHNRHADHGVRGALTPQAYVTGSARFPGTLAESGCHPHSRTYRTFRPRRWTRFRAH
ncbi:hypothetical protein CHELA20_53365 [Hyphomicrobiales bacterium]|nr:hypothetical protein CHELA20_53365 [Hyphomicrobiales bacterium]